MEQLIAESKLDSTPVPWPAMPALALGKHSHHHTIHSALATLEALGVGAHRISVERTGREAVEAGTVVRQEPAPGTPLRPHTAVRLRVAGLGFSHALPVGMWDSGGEREMGTRELLEGLDDPLEKLKHWFHEGAPLFRISPDDPTACARWLRLFGVEPQEWPRSLWYTLATLVAKLPLLSCTEQGCAFVLKTVLGLPVEQFRYRQNWSALPGEMRSGLGKRSSRLGVDLLLGDTVEEPATLEIHLGPLALDRYEYFAETAEGKQILRRLLEWIVPVSTRTELRWSVLDRNRAPQLGVRDGNSRLGINTHMGGRLGEQQPQTWFAESDSAVDVQDLEATQDREQPSAGVLQL
ncbi:type VI secretion system baseplate subunit TssG [Terriglobus aquaticus]|uniref:Type VI secretion system baseplate subunit TssG n=1 Tax=Terriglobus aquaticus TaxID=940139 RepID=A0ABW9KFS8_9BACT|nr:type VI secretion system baseplate subunit TssG [Terriglobus aquaticus]